MSQLKALFNEVRMALKPGKRCVIVAMDLRVGGTFIPFHMDIVTMMRGLGFVFEDLIIWNRSREYHNLRPLGYPYKFIVNKVHEYILIFRRDGPSSSQGISNPPTNLNLALSEPTGQYGYLQT